MGRCSVRPDSSGQRQGVRLTARRTSRSGVRPSLHTGGLRCESVTHSRKAPSSPRVQRAPERARCSRGSHHGLLSPLPNWLDAAVSPLVIRALAAWERLESGVSYNPLSEATRANPYPAYDKFLPAGGGQPGSGHLSQSGCPGPGARRREAGRLWSRNSSLPGCAPGAVGGENRVRRSPGTVRFHESGRRAAVPETDRAARSGRVVDRCRVGVPTVTAGRAIPHRARTGGGCRTGLFRPWAEGRCHPLIAAVDSRSRFVCG